MDALSDDSSTPRFFDFKKHPYDAVDPRLTYQFWPAFQSELKRKGLSNVLVLKFNPLPEEPTVVSHRIRHDEGLAKTREEESDKFLMAAGPQLSLGLLHLAPENERAANDNDRKEVRFFKK